MKLLTKLKQAMDTDFAELQKDYEEVKYIIKRYLKIPVDNDIEL